MSISIDDNNKEEETSEKTFSIGRVCFYLISALILVAVLYYVVGRWE
ncbi:MAG: hypothetical protein ABIG60_04925 [Patescibacteria group bacterium]